MRRGLVCVVVYGFDTVPEQPYQYLVRCGSKWVLVVRFRASRLLRIPVALVPGVCFPYPIPYSIFLCSPNMSVGRVESGCSPPHVRFSYRYTGRGDGKQWSAICFWAFPPLKSKPSLYGQSVILNL